MVNRFHFRFISLGLMLGLAVFGSFHIQGQKAGGIDTSYQFSPGGNPSGTPSSYFIGPDNKAVAVGTFTSYNGVARKNIVRLNTDGTVDTAFDPRTGPGDNVIIIPGVFTNKSPGFATSVAVQADGRVIVGGSFSSWDGFDTKNVARLKTDGSVDQTFKSTALAGGPILPLPDGKFLLAGKANDFSPRKTGIVRVNADGAIDSSFSDSTLGATIGTDAGQVTIVQMRRQPDGKIAVIFAGSKSFVASYGVARLNEDGTLDSSFKPAFAGTISQNTLSSLSPDAAGRLLVSGSGTIYDGQTVTKVFRLLGDGKIDPAFNYKPTGALASGVLALADGSVLVTGSFDGVTGPVIRVGSDGTRDTNFGFAATGPSGSLLVAVCTDPKISPAGEIFLSGTILLLNNSTLTQGAGVIRLTGSSGGGGATPPTITTQPQAASAVVGGSVTFTVAASGTPPLAYQWKFNGKDISGATAATLTITNIAEANGGDYVVAISNLGGSTISDAAKLTVQVPPRITSAPPATLNAGQGTTVTLTVIAEGTAPLKFQWFKDGAALANGTQSVLNITNVQATDVGSYEVEAANDFGRVRSAATKLTLSPSAATWFAASTNDGPGTVTDLWLDNPRGVVVAGNYSPAAAGAPEFTFGGTAFPRPAQLNGFVARVDDTGAPVWALPIVGDLSNGLASQSAVAVAADKDGNVFVAGPMRNLGEFSGLTLGAAGTEGTFLARLDTSGKGVWSIFITGNLYERQLAVDPDGNVILTGRYTKRLEGPGFFLTAVDTGACAICKFNSAGTAQWAHYYQRADTVGGSVDIYNVTANAGGIYVAGSFNQSIRFGNFTEKQTALPFHEIGWLGKLNSAGEPQWLRSIGGSIPTDLSLGTNAIWVVGFSDPPSSQALHGYRPDGSVIVQSTDIARSSGSVLARGVGVDSSERPIIGGYSIGFATVGSASLGIGQTPKFLWGAAANPSGVIGLDATMTAFLNASANSDIAASQFEASAQGDFYYAGNWTGTLNISSKSYQSAVRKIFVAKVAGIPQPSVPVFTQDPQSQLFALGENRTLNCTARGGGLTFRWLKDGAPLAESNVQIATYAGPRPGESACQITFLGVTALNAGQYVCEASNALGKALSNPGIIEIGAKPAIVKQPVPVLADLGGAITLNVEATGGGLQYQWFRAGATIPNATNASFTIPAAAAGDAGLYSVIVMNGLATITSDEVRVTVCSGEPEPQFLGRPWVKILDDSTTLPGTATKFGKWLSDDRPRFTLKDGTIHLAATAGAVNSLQGGSRALVRWRSGALETLVWTNTPAPGGGHFLDVFYPTDETDGAMNFTAYTLGQNGQTHAGLFEIRSGVITKRLDDTTPLPGGVGHFQTFGSNVRRGGTMIGYPGTSGDPTGDGSGIYAVTASGYAPLIKASATLPGTAVTKLGFLPSNFGLSFDGNTVIFSIGSEGLGQPGQAVYLSDLTGRLTRLAQSGDAIPGQAGKKFAFFGAADVAGATACFLGSDQNGGFSLIRSRGGQLETLGFATTIAAGSADLVYANSSPNLVSRFTGGAVTPETVLPASARLECRIIKSVWQVDAEGDDVVIGVDFTDGGVAIFACLSGGNVVPPKGLRLGSPEFVAGKLRFALPTEAGKTYRVEFKAELNSPAWSEVQTIPGDGASHNIELGTTGARGFYRVTGN